MEWFKSWFDSPYYHILYKNRNENEAHKFITTLVKSNYLNLKPLSNILDLACGQGRYSKKLCELGFSVIGIDLSKNSIGIAKEFENQNLKFFIGDMRKIHFLNKFDGIFNLFTSFGYFNSDRENFLVFDAIEKQLKRNGIFVFDYLNSNFLKENLVGEEIKFIDGIEFKIVRKILNNSVLKIIQVNTQNQNFQFQESVRLFNINQLREELKKRNLILENIFGSYELEDFNIKNSKRIIMIMKKK